MSLGPGQTPDSDPLHADNADVIEEPEFVEADAAPPPMTPPPQRAAAAAMPEVPEVTALDREFLQRVFVHVRDVDFRAPPPPPPRRDLTGPEKKIAALRQSIHELERDLARVGFLWGTVEQRYASTEALIAAKEGERVAAVERYQQIRDLAGQTATRDHGAIEAFKKRVAELEAVKSAREAELLALRQEAERMAADLSGRLTKSEQEKTALLAEFRSKMEAAQQAFNQLREQSTRAISEQDALVRQRDEQLGEKTVALATSEANLAEATRALEEGRVAIGARDEELVRLKDQRTQLVERLAERDKTLASFAAEMASSRTQQDAHIAELKETIRAREAALATTQDEVKSARREFDQLAAQMTTRTAELGEARAQMEALRGELAAAKAAVQRSEADLAARSVKGP